MNMKKVRNISEDWKISITKKNIIVNVQNTECGLARPKPHKISKKIIDVEFCHKDYLKSAEKF